MKKLLTGLAFCLVAVLLASVASAGAQEIPTQEADIDITLDLQSSGRCNVTVNAEAETGEPANLDEPPLSTLSAGEVDLEISSPSSGQLNIGLDVSVSLREGALDPQEKEQLGMIGTEMINTLLQSYVPAGTSLSDLLGAQAELPQEFADVTIDSISC